jgi:hypothetical protein
MVAQESPDRGALRTLMLMEGHPELRARHLQKHTRWTETLTAPQSHADSAARRSLRAA